MFNIVATQILNLSAMAGRNAPAQSHVTLNNFFIFNSTYAPKEGEEENKIMFYFPPATDIDTKIKDIGLCEAVIKFTETFSDKPCQSVHSQKRRQIFYEPEKDFWMVMTVNIPTTEKIKDGQPHTEYLEDDVQDHIYESVLKQAYKMFRLFMGSFYSVCKKGNVQSLKQRFDHFFSRYLLTLKLNTCDLLDVFNGIHFLPLDKNTYLQIQCFINNLEATFPQIHYSAFLYNDQLVWSGLEQEDMRIMYKYLTTSLFPPFTELELQGSSQSSPSASNQTGAVHYGRFITGPANLNDASNIGKVPRVFVNTDLQSEECHLLVYKALSANVCLLVDASFQMDLEFFRKLDSFLGPQLSELASGISEQYAKRPPSGHSDPQIRYIYFNHMNLAQKTTLHSDGRKSPNVTTPPEILRLIGDINHDMTRTCEDGETIIKTCSDYWVVGKRSDQREFYVVIYQKNANLILINEEVKRLCASNFSNIFFLD
ncbi:vacuolar fusion protein CCZ1 homolog [Tubulanus polymorphus]|uniref:vacuolar fusion protein CCZ1 homolog n=1 Tax=Tubulanus polymorphus TaxID=672921 RepID=UPI003DA2D001